MLPIILSMNDVLSSLVPVILFLIPIVAISGGIIIGVVKVIGRQRMLELAQRERIVAIERGVDPAKLPPLDVRSQELAGLLEYAERPQPPKRRAQDLLIGGLVTLFSGLGIAVFLLMLNPDDGRPVWAVGLIPAFVGISLLLSAAIVWPRGPMGNGGRQP